MADVIPQIVATGLSKTFSHHGDTVTAYQGLDFKVNAGEFLCILGPSGCGKSTVLRTIAALETPTQGDLHVAPNRDGSAAAIGMVFQERGVFPWMTVAQNIRFLLQNNPRLKGRDINAIVDEYVDMVGLTRFASSYPHQLSGGMNQRVSIARSFANDPDILLMDEPFVFLDYQTRQSLQELLLSIWQDSRKTVVFVTHDIEEAILLADRLLVMTAHPGQIKKVLTVDLPRPRHVHDIRKMPRYMEYLEQVTDLIREEIVDMDDVS